jgi:hypothetical protein
MFDLWPCRIAACLVSVEPLSFRNKVIFLRMLDETTVRVAWLLSQAKALSREEDTGCAARSSRA